MQRIVLYLTLLSIAIPASAVEVSRSKVDHPALGTTGGSALHAAIETIYKKLGDNANSRYQEYSAIADSTTVELDHNFGVNLDQLNVLIYTGSGSNLTRVPDPESQSPPWTIQEKTGSEKTVIEIITPSSGGPHTFAVVAIHGKGSEKLDDLSDVDVTTVAPAVGETIVWDGTNFVPGASGDASFKIESTTDPNALIKGGKYGLTNRRQLASYDGAGSASTDFQGDLTCDLDAILGTNPADDTTYNLFIDLNLVGNTPITTTDTAEEFYPVECSDMVLFTTFPEGTLGSRYVPVGFIHSADSGTVWSGTGAAVGTFAFRIHDQTYVTVSPVIYSLAEQAIGSVGSSGQVVAGHSLTSESFSSTPAALSWWNLETDINDDSANGRNLTIAGAFTFTATDLFGVASNAADCNGAANANSTDSALRIQSGGTSFTAFAWANPDAFNNGRLLSSSSGSPAAEPNGFGWGIQFAASDLLFNLSEDGTDLDFRPAVSYTNAGITAGQWSHIAVTYDSSAQIAKIYVDGILQTSLATPGLTLAETNTFYVCSDAAVDFNGQVTQAGFEKRAFTAEEIRKLASYRIDHNKNVALADQNWVATFNGNLANQLDNGWIVDKSTNSLWFDFFDLASTDSVSIKLKNENASAHVLPLNTFDTGFLSAAPSFPLSHGLGSVPTQVEVIHEGQTTAGDYDDVRDKCSWDETQITCTGLNTVDGTHRLRIVMSTSTVAVAVAAASGTESGIVTTQAQTFAGDKTFNNNIRVAGNATVGTTTLPTDTLFAVDASAFGVKVPAQFKSDTAGRGAQVTTSDYVGGSAGTAIHIEMGAGTGDTYSQLRSGDQGSNSPAQLRFSGENFRFNNNVGIDIDPNGLSRVFHVHNTGAADAGLHFTNSATGSSPANGTIQYVDNNGNYIMANQQESADEINIRHSGNLIAKWNADGAVTPENAMELNVRNDSNCGIGNVCSGTFTVVESTITNLVSTPSITVFRFIRVGNVVTFSFRMDLWDPDGGGNPSILFTVPFNPISTTAGGGTCHGTAPGQLSIRGSTTTQLELIDFDSTNHVNGTYYCSGTYGL